MYDITTDPQNVRPTDEIDARREAYEADDAWSAELARVFGAKAAGDMRYVTAGRGMPGSTLRKAYELREATRIAWQSYRQVQS